MRIQFRYPNNKNGHEISIRNNALTGVREVLIDGGPAERLTATIYSYPDIKAGKVRKIEIINVLFGNPKIEIYGKDVNAFPEVPLYEKIIMFVPFVSVIIAGVGGFISASVFLLVSLSVTRSMGNRFIRGGFLVILAVLAFIAAIYLNTFLMPLWELMFGVARSS